MALVLMEVFKYNAVPWHFSLEFLYRILNTAVCLYFAALSVRDARNPFSTSPVFTEVKRRANNSVIANGKEAKCVCFFCQPWLQVSSVTGRLQSLVLLKTSGSLTGITKAWGHSGTTSFSGTTV